jgi:chromatin remodeling complex protein RSC6
MYYAGIVAAVRWSGKPDAGYGFNLKGDSQMAKAKAKKANSAFMKPMKVSAALSEVVGKGPMPRSGVVKKLWAYIKKNKLQDTKNRRNINADASLKIVFAGKKVVNMFEMTKLVNKHLS